MRNAFGPIGAQHAANFSVVVPTYNRAALLPATLAAILAQTLPPREVIVVDDGSTDETQAVLAGFAPAVHSIRIRNSGDLVARNVGLRASIAPLVAFCDSDDLWRPEFLAAMADLWSAEPATKLAYSDFVIVRDGAWEDATKFADAPSGFWHGLRAVAPGVGVFDVPIVERLLGFQPCFPSCLVAGRDFLLGIGGWDEGTSRMIGCDFATALRLAEHVPFGIVARPLVGIRKHSGNISGDAQAMALGDSRVLEHVLASRPWLAPLAPAIKASIGQRRREALEIAFARGDLACVAEIYPLLPVQERGRAVRVKHAIAGWPAPAGPAVATVLRRLGTLRARVLGDRLPHART